MHFTFSINPDGSKFSYADLARTFRQNFDFIAAMSSHTFAPLTETTERKGTAANRIIKFSPREDFNVPTHMAIGGAGVNFNTRYSDRMDLQELRGLALHELGHNVGLKHTENRHSVMTVAKFRSGRDKSLLWRSDILSLHAVAPLTEKPIGYVSVNEELDIMIPALMWQGEQWAVKLRYIERGRFWLVDKHYPAGDGVRMVERAFLTPGDVLELEDVNYLGTIFPKARLQIDADQKLRILP